MIEDSQTSTPASPVTSTSTVSLTPAPPDGATKKTRTAKRKNKKRKRTEKTVDTTPGQTPWLESLGMTEYESKEQRLHDEVLAFVNFMEPTDQERRARELVIARVSDIVKRRFTACTITLFGSVAQGLALPDSDIDIAVQTPQIYESSFKTRSMFQIASMLKTALITRGGQVAVGARVPVLSFPTVVALGSFNVDISINADDGTKAVQLVQDYSERMPVLRPLVLVIKAFLSQKALNSPANGGLGSYAVLCLAVCFLQLNPKGRPVEYIQKPLEFESLGALVMDFLDYFGNEFPYSTSYVAAAQGKVLPKESMGWSDEACPDALSVECLMNPGHDIGKATTRIAQVRSAFQEAYTTLAQYPFSMTHGNVLGSIVSMSEKTLDRRQHLKHLVDSGTLESDLAAITLPPAWSTPQNPKQHQPHNRRKDPPPHVIPCYVPYHPSYHPSYSSIPGGHGVGYPSAYPAGGYRPPYPSYNYSPPYLNYGSPSPSSPAILRLPIPQPPTEDIHRSKRQKT